MMRPTSGSGFKAGGLIYDYLSGWTDHDKPVVTVLCTTFSVIPEPILRESVLALMAWADAGMPERADW